MTLLVKGPSQDAHEKVAHASSSHLVYRVATTAGCQATPPPPHKAPFAAPPTAPPYSGQASLPTGRRPWLTGWSGIPWACGSPPPSILLDYCSCPNSLPTCLVTTQTLQGRVHTTTGTAHPQHPLCTWLLEGVRRPAPPPPSCLALFFFFFHRVSGTSRTHTYPLILSNRVLNCAPRVRARAGHVMQKPASTTQALRRAGV